LTRRRRPERRLCLEALEARTLPSHTAWPGLAAPSINVAGSTLGAAYLFPAPLAAGGRLSAIGTITNTAAGGGNVDWYAFRLTEAADVTVTAPLGQGGGIVAPVLTLYENDLLNPADPTQRNPYAPTGHRELAQDDGVARGGVAIVERVLAPGTYYVAVSGSGDRVFSALVAGSGTTGGTGDYGLLIRAAALAQPAAGPGPAVIAADPNDGADLDRSPFGLYLTLSTPIDPSTIAPGVNVVLTDVTAGMPVQLQQNAVNPADPTNGVLFNPAANELEIFPEAPLAPGDTYQLQLVGRAAANPGVPVILGTNGEALGSTAAGADGQDYLLTFRVTGVKGVNGATTAFNAIGTSFNLNLSSSALVQVHGAIGDDPFALAMTGAVTNDVDLYHFTVPGTGGHYAFMAAAEAGRIGSPLDPALALFRQLPDGTVILVGADNDSGNPTQLADHSRPFQSDSLLYVGLVPGDYYLAVGGAFNLPDPVGIGVPYAPGSGFFDPLVPYSAQIGAVMPLTVGDYVLSASLRRDDVAPHLTGVDGIATPTAAQPRPVTPPPSEFTLHFDKPVNLRQLGYEQDMPFDVQGNPLSGPDLPGAVSAVWVRGSDGNVYYPRLRSYDDASNTATFYMLDAVPLGDAELHIDALTADGSPGLTDLAGNWLDGSDASGDYIIPFTVGGLTRTIDPATHFLTWTALPGETSLQDPQQIGPLFPNELGADQLGVNHAVDFLGRGAPQLASQGGPPLADFYEVQLLQDRIYSFTLTDRLHPVTNGRTTPTNSRVRLFTLDGREIPTDNVNPFIFTYRLTAGKYVIEVCAVDSSGTGDPDYRLRVALGTSMENAVALTTGAAPAYAIAPQRSAAPAPTPPAAGTPVLTLPEPSTGAAASTAVTTGGPAVALALPAGTLTSLSAPPVGGERPAGPTSPAAPDRLVLNDSGNSASGGGSVQFASLRADTPAGDDGVPVADRPGGLIRGATQFLDRLEKAAIDLIFRNRPVAEWLMRLWTPFVVPDLLLPNPDPADGPEMGEEQQGEAPAAPADGTASGPPEDWVVAGGLVLSAGYVLTPRSHDARPPALRRRRRAI
jgi:hypothetical protein